MNRTVPIAALLLAHTMSAAASDHTALCADRAAIEHVYYTHRLGTKPPFEEAMPPELIERVTRLDLHKESVLRQRYGVEITSAMVAAEVQRIDSTTRAPKILAQIKHALGDDPERFARSMARPIVVERELRFRFDNDDALHATQRQEAEQARKQLLAGQSVAAMHEVTWQLTPRPEDDLSTNTTPPPQTQGKAKSGIYSVEATAQVAQPLCAPSGETDRKLYFEDLDPELQNVLRVQLQNPGDVSAVIETPGGFLLFLAKEKSAESLTAASLSIPKRSYEVWLEEQEEKT